MPDSSPYCLSPRSTPGPAHGTQIDRECLECSSGYLADDRIAFRHCYEQYAPSRVEGWIPDRRLLEVRCGNGHFFSVAKGRGWDVRGVELSRTHVARAQDATGLGESMECWARMVRPHRRRG